MDNGIKRMTLFGDAQPNDRPKNDLLNEISITTLKVDESIKLIFGSDDKALIRFINSVFKKMHNPETANVTFLQSEFISKDFEDIHADMMISVDKSCYHIEFQTNFDKTMVIRMFEYGTAKAIENVRASGETEGMVFELPMPLIIQIEESAHSKDAVAAKIKISGTTDELAFKVPVINLWKFTLAEAIQREWFLLIPYTLLKYRKLFSSANGIERFKDDFKSSLKETRESVSRLYKNQEISKRLAVFMDKALKLIIDHINEKFLHDEDIKKEANQMFSEINPLGSEVLDAILQKGRQEGRQEVLEKVTAFLKVNGIPTDGLEAFLADKE